MLTPEDDNKITIDRKSFVLGCVVANFLSMLMVMSSIPINRSFYFIGSFYIVVAIIFQILWNKYKSKTP